MQVQINLKSHAESQLVHLVALLRSMDFVENVKIQPDVVVAASSSTQKEPSFFEQFYGKTNSGMTIDEIDEQLKTLRSEVENE